MLKRNPYQRAPEQDQSDDAAVDASISFDEILGIARRQAWIVALVGVIGAGLGVAHAFTATPQYTASTKILLDNAGSKLSQLDPFNESGSDNATVLSQVELLRSEKVVGAVVDKMKIADDQAAAAAPPGLGARALDWVALTFNLPGLGSDATKSLEDDPEAARAAAIRRTSGALDVKRLGMTYILNVAYTDPSPTRAASIANAFADAYIGEQIDTRLQSAKQASGWLRQRIEELTLEAQQADLKVQQFRATNRMVAVDGQRMDEQQLKDLNTQLTEAIGANSAAQAKYKRIEEIIASGDLRSLVTEALGSTIIIDLRQKYLGVDKQAQELEALVGAKHKRVLDLREEMRRYEAQIFEELQRIRESSKSELAISREREADLKAKVAALSSVSAGNNEVLVQQRALEDRANTARAMLQTLLQRDQEAQQGQSFAMSDARVISPASVPSSPSYPKKSHFALMGLLLGLASGAGLGYVREMADRSFRTGKQVERLLGLPLIGAIPLMSEAAASRRRAKSRLIPAGSDTPDAGGDAENPSGRLVDYAVSAPMSAFAEALRSVKLSVDVGGSASGGRVVGFVSINPGEGKSTLSKNFASLMALSGFRTILIDADLRAHGLTRYVDRDTQAGLVEVLEGTRHLEEVLRTETISGLDVLLAVVNRRIFNSAELLSSKAMRALLERLREEYDYVILDLPPIGPVVDAKAIAGRLDAIALVVEWGVTVRHSVKTVLAGQQPVVERCVGVIFNKVDPKRVHLYDYYGSNYYGYGRYNSSNGYQNYYVEERGRRSAKPAGRGGLRGLALAALGRRPRPAPAPTRGEVGGTRPPGRRPGRSPEGRRDDDTLRD